MTDLSIDTTSAMPGTVKFYNRHVVVCTGNQQWQLKIETGNPFISALTKAIKADKLLGFTKITACDMPSMGEGYDIMLFPENKKFIGLTETDIVAFVQVLQGHTNVELIAEPLAKPIWLICGHLERDGRCGELGPAVLSALDEALTATGRRDSVELYISSHVGQHRFAGNIICYPGGDWYGRVIPADVNDFIEAELDAKKPLARLWRGRMGMQPSAQIILMDEAPNFKSVDSLDNRANP